MTERELSQSVEVVGRVRRPYVTVTVCREDVGVRVDSETDLAFWVQVRLSREVLIELLRQMDEGEVEGEDEDDGPDRAA